jgi:uncharacterized protein (UPF0371 family)
MRWVSRKRTRSRSRAFYERVHLTSENRNVVTPAREAADKAQELHKGNEGIYCGASIALKDGTINNGSNSPLMHAATSLIIHAIKHLAGIPEQLTLLPDYVTESVRNLKTRILNERSVSLDLEEALIVLASAP